MLKWNDFKISWLDRQKALYILIFLSIIITLFLFDIANKRIEKARDYSNYNLTYNKDLLALKDFFLNKLESPFVNSNYQIQKGDTVEKILRKHEINKTDIARTITEYKKYHKEKKNSSGKLCRYSIKKRASI